MKLNKSQLRQIIREELAQLNERDRSVDKERVTQLKKVTDDLYSAHSAVMWLESELDYDLGALKQAIKKARDIWNRSSGELTKRVMRGG